MDLIREINTLPIEERALIADSVLKSLNNSDREIENIWGEVAEKRLNEIRTGKVEAIDGKEVICKKKKEER